MCIAYSPTEGHGSQTGKTYFISVLSALYNVVPTQIAKTTSSQNLDSELNKALTQPNWLIYYDNIRGQFRRQYLESFLTNPNPSLREQYVLMFSANVGPEEKEPLLPTRDILNRASIISLEKPKQWKVFDEGYVKDYVQVHHDEILRCVLTICKTWVEQGCLKDVSYKDNALSEWGKILNHIVKNMLGLSSIYKDLKGNREKLLRPLDPSHPILDQLFYDLKECKKLDVSLRCAELIEVIKPKYKHYQTLFNTSKRITNPSFQKKMCEILNGKTEYITDAYTFCEKNERHDGKDTTAYTFYNNNSLEEEAIDDCVNDISRKSIEEYCVLLDFLGKETLFSLINDDVNPETEKLKGIMERLKPNSDPYVIPKGFIDLMSSSSSVSKVDENS